MASLAEPGPFISTGQLPSPELVRALVDEAYDRFRLNAEGENTQVYPALATVPADLFGLHESIHSHVRDGLKSPQSLLRRTSS